MSDMKPEDVLYASAGLLAAKDGRIANLERKLVEAREVIKPFAALLRYVVKGKVNKQVMTVNEVVDIRRAVQWEQDNQEK